MNENRKIITIKTVVNAPKEKVWKLFNNPKHVMLWNNASPDWHTPKAENDLRKSGAFNYRMEAKDGSFGFDFSGQYDDVKQFENISYTLDDGRKVSIEFKDNINSTEIIETFEAENENPIDMQQQGWQAILDNFKNYVGQLAD